MPASCCCRAPPSRCFSFSRSAASGWLGRGRNRWRLFAAAVILGGLFLRNQRRSPEPIVPPHFLRDRVIRPVLATIFLIFGSYLALAVLAPIYFQVALGMSVSDAGLLMIPLGLAQRLDGEYRRPEHAETGRYKCPPLLGMPVAIVALASWHSTPIACRRLRPPPVSMVVGLGIGPIFPCSTVAAQNAAARGQLGAVSGGVAFSRALGGAIGVAAASALVLGLAAGALTSAGQITSLEDLARVDLSPEARDGVARAFGVMFGAVAAALAIGLAVFMRVEDRPLGERSPLATNPGAE